MKRKARRKPARKRSQSGRQQARRETPPSGEGGQTAAQPLSLRGACQGLRAAHDRALAAAEQHRWVVPVSAFIYIATLVLFGTECYLMNDNPAMLEDIRQGYAVSFMTMTMGKLLSLPYQIHGTTPWLGLFFYGVLWVSLSLSLWTLLSHRRTNVRFLLVPLALFYLAAYSYFILRVGFNGACLMSGVSALCAFLVLLDRDRLAVRSALSLGVLFSMSYLIRKEGIMGISVFGFPACILLVLPRLKSHWRLIGCFLAPALLAVCVECGCVAFTQTSELARFREFNGVRGEFHGFPVARWNWGNKELLRENDWTLADYALLMAFMHVHEEKFSVQKLRNIFRLSVPRPVEENPLRWKKLTASWKTLWRYYWCFCLALACTVAMALVGGDRFTALAVPGYVAYVLAGMTAMSVFKRYPTRIGFPFSLLSLLLVVHLLARKPLVATPRKRWVAARSVVFAAMGLAVVVLALFHIRDTRRFHRHAAARARQFEASWSILNTEYKGETLLVQPGELHREFSSPFRTYVPSFTELPVGYMIYSPRFYDAIHAVGIENASGILPWFVDRDGAYVVFNETAIAYVVHFLRQTYGLICRPEEVRRLPIGPRVYQLKRASQS